MSFGEGRLVVVSNRLPVTTEIVSDGVRVTQSNGGLVSALLPILRRHAGCWVGWPGSDDGPGVSNALKSWCASEDYSLQPVFLTPLERDHYYRGFSNEIIWPLFHGVPSRCEFGIQYWDAYKRVNAKFAGAMVSVAAEGDLIWVHDYHLMLVADEMRIRRRQNRLAYFHHIPFPSPDTLAILPWRARILRALISFDVIGFQTPGDQRNFIACLERFLPELAVEHIEDKTIVDTGGRRTLTGVYPIGVDFQDWTRAAAEPSVIEECLLIRRSLGGTRIILGVDRLDYTKGIPERLAAFRRLLALNPEFCELATFVQIVVPSREDISEYRELRVRIENLVSQINGEFGSRCWVPIRYFHRRFSHRELAAYYGVANVAMVTPLKDGMNLVAKEFCASRVDGRGVLILSEFAGAAGELSAGALIVNPHDQEQMKSVLDGALCMDEFEQRARMHLMRMRLRNNDIFRWARLFLADCCRDPSESGIRRDTAMLS